ncbi:MAG: diguanylate phosphodiesterase, partial [Nakamurella sp.]
MVAGSEVLGELVLTRAGTPRPADLRVLERAAMVTALLLLFSRQVFDAANRGRRDLLEDLLLGATLADVETGSRAAHLNVDLNVDMVLVVCETPRLRADSEQAAAFLAARKQGLAAHINGVLVMLLPGSDAGVIAREVSTALGRTLGGPVTAAGQAVGLINGHSPGRRHFPQAYAAARSCLTAMLALGRDGQRATMADLGFVGVVLSGGDSRNAFDTDTLGTVLDYDAARGTD